MSLNVDRRKIIDLKCILSLFLLYITSLSLSVNAANNGNVIDNIINVDLSSLNITNNVFKTYQTFNGYAEIHLEDIPYHFGYLLVQVHSFKNIIVLSKDSDFGPETSVNGTNVGLIDFEQTNFTTVYYLSGNYNLSDTLLIVIIGHDIKDPIPGGCNLTFDVEIAPYQVVTNPIDSIIAVDFQAPALFGGYCPKDEIKFEMYHMYLEEWDLSNNTYFKGIEKMLTFDSILQHGRKVHKPTGFPIARRYFAAYKGTGSVFAIAAYFRGFTSAYVPAVSYGCDAVANRDNCYEPISVLWKILYGAMVFIGLFLCLQGHKFFKVSLFFTGFFVAAIISYIIFPHEETIITLSIIGIIYGAFWVVVWWIYGIPVLSVTLSFFVTGYLISSFIFYIGMADLPIFRNDINYWSVLIGIALLVTLVLLILSSLHSNILATSFLGAYMILIPLDQYIGGNISYIFFNTIHRATVPRFNLAVIDPPIQINDLYLLIVWLFLTVFGVYFQWRQNRGRAPFPPPSNSPRHEGSERTPLLSAFSVRYG